MQELRRLWREESGEDVVEYVLLALLISLTLVAAMKTLGRSKIVK